MMYKALFSLVFAVFSLNSAHAQEADIDETADAVAADFEANMEVVSEAAEAAMEVDPFDPTSNRSPFPKRGFYPTPTPFDYPADSHVNGEEGLVRLTLDIDAEGTVTDCKVSESSGHLALDKASCAVALRDAPEFEPAKDERGNAVASKYELTIDWNIREPELQPMVIDVRLTIGTDGKVSECEALETSGTLFRGFDRTDPCKNMNRSGDIYRDENGQPVAKKVRIRMTVEVDDVPE
ncbi:energy transducer TonB [Pontixanthobacter aquaemixtae]|uniref:TonB family protein n=1 Tax=Pontixanthobacter aquaemixtae TaxID=1958940 RepID=A0A844ZQQ3_9SPHN|nr:energy transducer TonB [Pontixanthobacter aquaemixtae]MXO90078.1 TonB family protein [Pontixanthobacter aquaemixtae]